MQTTFLRSASVFDERVQGLEDIKEIQLEFFRDFEANSSYIHLAKEKILDKWKF
jgi:hypothetical protein